MKQTKIENKMSKEQRAKKTKKKLNFNNEDANCYETKPRRIQK